MNKDEMAEKIESIVPGLVYNAVFIPKHLSRNAEEKNMTLNWRVSLSLGSKTVASDYSQGTGFLPKYNPKPWQSRDKRFAEEEACRNGTWLGKPVPKPKLADVLSCMILDSSVLDHSSFESWAADFGYDSDSRKAEACYRECLEHALSLQRMLGNEKLQKLRELFQDY